MEKIGIFCSASGNIDKMYFDMAGRIGKWMGETGKLLYMAVPVSDLWNV